MLEATVSEAPISRVFLSGGTLTAQDAVTVSLPGDIQIKSYAVQSGDTVQAGDLIATVEKSSVLSGVRNIQSVMAELDEALGELTEDNDAEVTSAAAGRVKLIYAEAGTPVADTMAQYGALAVLSLDGLMCAEIP
ncbi:MAG: hypothetical protein IKT99_06830, partial [Oscillospiraceae bacterium]|nr:hypothetical protein [Oscillospiraceae bacterium]